MLHLITGAIQIGKTRWLLQKIDELERSGVEPCGVVAPGVWKPCGNGFEKLGIDNLLLPNRELVPFARRVDLAQAGGDYDEGSQSARAGLRWAIDDSAIARVNEHFGKLAEIDEPGNRMLVVDELGQLELMRGEGLTNAVGLLDRGATPAFPHAIVVVREDLLSIARERFTSAPWGGMQDIRPN